MPTRNPTRDVSDWLTELGLSQYVQLFAENHVDGQLLRTITGEDLREIGVTSFGHRKTILQAIARLGGTPPGSASPELVSAGGPERRQLTVLFVDLVASTELATRLDPEDMGDVLHLYQNTVAGEINRVEGYVAKLMGDGALAYFGWPRARRRGRAGSTGGFGDFFQYR